MSDIGWVALIPHSLTLVIELQAYVLLMLGAYVLGRHWIWPRSVGAESRRGATSKVYGSLVRWPWLPSSCS